MMGKFWQTTRGALRAGFMALAIAGLAACGGGGGDDGDTGGNPPPGVDNPLPGSWQLAVRAEGETSAFINVPATAVPSAEEVAAISTAETARVFASAGFQGYTVTVNGATVTVTGPGTNMVLTITGVRGANYKGCDPCGVNSRVSFDVIMNFTQSGTVDGQPVPGGSGSLTVTFIYRRAA